MPKCTRCKHLDFYDWYRCLQKCNDFVELGNLDDCDCVLFEDGGDEVEEDWEKFRRYFK